MSSPLRRVAGRRAGMDHPITASADSTLAARSDRFCRAEATP